jgi:hypothetical protein
MVCAGLGILFQRVETSAVQRCLTAGGAAYYDLETACGTILVFHHGNGTVCLAPTLVESLESHGRNQSRSHVAIACLGSLAFCLR